MARGGGKAFVFPWAFATGGGGTSWTPLSDADTIIWYDAYTGLSSSGGTFTSWTDRASGVVMTPGGSPTVESRQVTFSPCVHLDQTATDQYLKATIGPVISGTNQATIFLVACHPYGWEGVLFEYGGDSTGTQGTFGAWSGLYAPREGITYFAGGSKSVTANMNESLYLPRVLSFQHDFSRSTDEQRFIHADSVDYALTRSPNYDTSTPHPNSDLYIGRRFGSGTYWWHGRVMSLVIVKRAMSPADVARFETYLRQRYTMPLSLVGRRTPRILHLGQSNAQGNAMSITTDPIRQYAGPWDGYIRAYRSSNLDGVNTITEGWRWAAPRQLGVAAVVGYVSHDFVAMGRMLTDYGYAPEIIECTQGGTSLAVDWAAGGTLYTRFLATYDAALAAHPAPPSSPEPIIFWTQGESDASASPVYAANYGTNLADLFYRIGVDRPALANAKIVIPKLSLYSANGDVTNRTNVRAGQQAFADANPTRVRVIETNDLTFSDGVHYDAASHYTLGVRVAAAAAELLG